MKGKRNFWVLALFLLIGVFLGGLLGEAVGSQVPFLILSTPTYGIFPPVTLALGPLQVVFGISLQMSVAMVLGLALAYVAYRAL